MGVYPVKFSRCSTIILMDSMESILRDRNRVVDPTKMGRVIGKYVKLFSFMTSGWKRVVYLHLPMRHTGTSLTGNDTTGLEANSKVSPMVLVLW